MAHNEAMGTFTVPREYSHEAKAVSTDSWLALVHNKMISTVESSNQSTAVWNSTFRVSLPNSFIGLLDILIIPSRPLDALERPKYIV
jgi:hypothetical protein